MSTTDRGVNQYPGVGRVLVIIPTYNEADNIRIIVDEVHHPFCEASPDFCNWEHEYYLFNGLKALAPYSHTNVHAKYWDRWGDQNDVRRSTRIMMAAGFTGTDLGLDSVGGQVLDRRLDRAVPHEAQVAVARPDRVARHRVGVDAGAVHVPLVNKL